MSQSNLILLSWQGKAVRGNTAMDSNATHSSNQIVIQNNHMAKTPFLVDLIFVLAFSFLLGKLRNEWLCS